MKPFSLLKRSEFSEHVLAPVTLVGVVVPWTQSMGDGRTSDYKLVCASGGEYFFVADEEWQQVLSHYKWEDVKVKGLLDIANMTLIPQRVFPKGPTGERDNVIDLAAWKGRDIVQKLTKNVTELVLVPAAVFAIMS